MYEGDWGNNPWPVATDEEDRCCDECNERYVIPARLMLMAKRRTNVVANEIIDEVKETIHE